ncbi:MAG: NYN domain-containing protein [Candidatus ainarchaeum sp.]|jgi:uncharacterized LabA/DUF88 family protein|nr:NYN domain-containing protein [Candidatus ainarchaeum sp.]
MSSFFDYVKKQQNNVYVFIDASNIWETQKAKGKFLDFEKLKKYIIKEFNVNLIKFFYYTAYPKNGTREYNLDGKHHFFTFLKKGLGFEVRKKELKRITIINEQGQSIKEKGNMDVEITMDAMYHLNKYNIALLFSGDSDFLSLLSHIKNNNKKIVIFSSENNISSELRTGGSKYIDLLNDVKDDIWGRDLKYRKFDK